MGSKPLGDRLPVERDVPLRLWTTLRVGGHAEFFAVVRSCAALAEYVAAAQRVGMRTTVLGSGSNVLPSDDGVSGLVLVNLARAIDILPSGEVLADTGCLLQDLFLATAQLGLAGFSFAVGIPGSLGGALVSNAGAYRSNVSEALVALEIVFEGHRQWVEPAWMEFAYRDSRLRRPDPVACCLVRARFQLERADPKALFDAARDYQRQRISKQPAPASAGSFFKNVNSRDLAAALPGLPDGLKAAGVVPAGYLIEAAGLKGLRGDGVCCSMRHANFVLNDRGGSASAIRALTEHVKGAVREKFGVELEEEVLWLGRED